MTAALAEVPGSQRRGDGSPPCFLSGFSGWRDRGLYPLVGRGGAEPIGAAIVENKATANQSPRSSLVYQDSNPKECLRVNNWIVQGLYHYAVKETVEL